MTTIKKFRLSLAYDMDKEAEWLTEMSAKGFHFFKFSWGFYSFEEDHNKSYIYQTDFQGADDEYFELYAETGWEHVQTAMESYHYFRADKNAIGDKRIYSDPVSVKGMYQRMLLFYSTLFICILVAQAGLLLSWKPTFFSFLSLAIVSAVVVLYIFLLGQLVQKINKYDKKSNVKY